MTRDSCVRTADLLVDYCDGELSPADRTDVEAHLADCNTCRSKLQLLRESLRLAQSVWQEMADQAETALQVAESQGHLGRGSTERLATNRSVVAVRGGKRRLRSAMALAGCAVLVLLATGVWRFWPNRSHDDVARSGRINGEQEVTAHALGAGQATPPLDGANIEAIINRQARSARLAAAVQFLAAEPSLKAVHDQAERYLVRAYSDVPVGDPPAEGKSDLPHKEPKS